MRESETAKLLAWCAAYDQRTTGEADILAWHEALASPWVPNLGLEEAQTAVTEHYRATAERITPADVLKRVKDTRSANMQRVAPKAAAAPPSAEYLEARAAYAPSRAVAAGEDSQERARDQVAASRLDRHAELDGAS